MDIEQELWARDQQNTPLEERAAHELKRRREEIERLRAALREVDSQLMNMQPHIASLEEHCGNVGRTRFIDDHVDAALDVIRKAWEAKG